MATWIIFKNHLLAVDSTQNHETIALRTLTTVTHLILSCVSMICLNKNSLKLHLIEGPTTLEDLQSHYMILEVHWDGLRSERTLSYWMMMERYPQISRKRLTIRFPAIKSLRYLRENLPGGQLPPML